MVVAQEVDCLAVLPGDGTKSTGIGPATFGQPPAEFLGVVLAAWLDGAHGQDSQFVLQQVGERSDQPVLRFSAGASSGWESLDSEDVSSSEG